MARLKLPPLQRNLLPCTISNNYIYSMANKKLYRIKTISELHQFRNLPKPEHPLISIIDFDSINNLPENNSISWVLDFYSIALKRTSNTKIKYGQQDYDFDEGVLFFMAPSQVFSIEVDKDVIPKHSGWL